jgi:hypothetical protein
MGCYHDKLLAAAIDSPLTLTGMPHGDAMDILKELDVLPGHRHLLMQACVKATEQSELVVSVLGCKLDVFHSGSHDPDASARTPTGMRVVSQGANHVPSR